jgi:hypothetical protein
MIIRTLARPSDAQWGYKLEIPRDMAKGGEGRSTAQPSRLRGHSFFRHLKMYPIFSFSSPEGARILFSMPQRTT